MVIYFVTTVIAVVISILLLLLCLGKKKKKNSVTGVRYENRNSNLTNDASDSERGLLGTDFTSTAQPQVVSLNGNEERRPHSSSQTSQVRELPQPPVLADENIPSQRNSTDALILKDSDASDDNPDTKRSSPKGRRLPIPPPGNQTNSAINKDEDIQDDEDMYAKVEDAQKKVEPVRLKIKTLDINEGSGDSAFYAKVGESTEVDDTDLYAQVDDKTLGLVEEAGDEKEDAEESAKAGPSTSNPAPAAGTYTAPEYASIDRIKKAKSIKKKTVSDADVAPAPPIPDRNFDADEEMNEAENEESENTSQNTEEPAKTPMYDKLCVRESLDHIRQREEAEEKEKQLRYANLPQITCEGSNPGDVYAQIDEDNPEGVYESLSQQGSADGSYHPSNIAGYSSIRDLQVPNGLPQIASSSNNPPVDLQTRPNPNHHYELIERPQIS